MGVVKLLLPHIDPFATPWLSMHPRNRVRPETIPPLDDLDRLVNSRLHIPRCKAHRQASIKVVVQYLNAHASMLSASNACPNLDSQRHVPGGYPVGWDTMCLDQVYALVIQTFPLPGTFDENAPDQPQAFGKYIGIKMLATMVSYVGFIIKGSSQVLFWGVVIYFAKEWYSQHNKIAKAAKPSEPTPGRHSRSPKLPNRSGDRTQSGASAATAAAFSAHAAAKAAGADASAAEAAAAAAAASAADDEDAPLQMDAVSFHAPDD